MHAVITVGKGETVREKGVNGQVMGCTEVFLQETEYRLQKMREQTEENWRKVWIHGFDYFMVSIDDSLE